MNKALESLEKIKLQLKDLENALLDADPLCIIKGKHLDLCGEFLHCCREHPDMPWEQIPEAAAALKTVEEYEWFILKYFKIDLSPKQENK